VREKNAKGPLPQLTATFTKKLDGDYEDYDPYNDGRNAPRKGKVILLAPGNEQYL
jgi:hypothetical protein